MAVSPDSITALVPSNTALATSDTSARVGVGAVTIDSSIWVAVITGLPWATPVRMICFWMWGTSSSGRRTPRSPRATITPSATWRMSSRLATAGPVSILATIIGPSEPMARRTAATSSAVCTNDTATESMPARQQAVEEAKVLLGRRPQGDPVLRQRHPGAAAHHAAASDLGPHAVGRRAP